MNSPALIYFPSQYIVDYITKNRIDWDQADLARRGGWGDRAGIPPTPAVAEFLSLLTQKGDMFTQKEYMEHCFSQWSGWLQERQQMHWRGLQAKLYRNFYPSMIDSLHVWAMLCETRRFDSCFLSSYEDAIGKTDLIVMNGDIQYRLALLFENAKENLDYKKTHRHRGDVSPCIEIVLPKIYPRNPGNKRWYKIQEVLKAIYGKPVNQLSIFDLKGVSRNGTANHN